MREQERVAYYNGEFMPESAVRIPYRDSAAILGIGVHDTARTFDGKLFRLRQHVERFWRNMEFLRIEPRVTIDELEEISLEVLRRNQAIFSEELRVTQRASRGPWDPTESFFGPPTLIVECSPIKFAGMAPYFVEGLQLVTSTLRRTPGWAENPQAKTVNRLNLMLAQEDVWGANPKAWALLTDENGNLAEGRFYNVFVVRGGAVLTPRRQYVLSGITREAVIELARGLGMPMEECDIDFYDAYDADEIFVASTSVCVCPVASLNGRRPKVKEIPGPVTRRLQRAFSEMVGIDYVAQFLDHLPG